MITVKLGDDAAFNQLVHGGLPQASDVTVAVKDAATTAGRPGAVLSFDVRLPDGRIAKAQATVTVRELAGLYSMLRGRYGPGGPQEHRFIGEDVSPFINYPGTNRS